MRKFKAVLLSSSLRLFASLLLCLSFLHAESFKVIGSRAMAVGGACVAACEGSLAQYWNPANFSPGAFELNITGGGEVQATGNLLKEVNDIAGLASSISRVQTLQTAGTAISTLTATEMQTFIKAVKEISDLNGSGTGVLVGGNVQGSIKISKFGLSVLNTTEIGGSPFVDTSFVSLGGIGGQSALSAVGNFNGGVLTDVGTTAPPTSLTATRDDLATYLCNNFASVMPDFNGDAATPGAAACSADAQRLANELVNQANSAGLSQSDIANVAQTLTQVAGNNAVSGSSSTFANNTTNLTVRGAGLTELALTIPLPIPHVFGLSFGTNLKIIRGDMAYTQVNVLSQNQSIGNILTNGTQNTVTSYKPAIDLGMSWDLQNILPLRFGAVARNINRPSFDKPKDNPLTAIKEGEGGSFKTDPQVRAGVAFWPLGKHWTIMSDIDLTNNSTLVPGFKSRYGSIGTELMIGGKGFGLALRAGALKNLAEKLKPVITGGVGLNFLHLSFEVAGGISTKTVLTETGNKIPESAYATGNFAFRF